MTVRLALAAALLSLMLSHTAQAATVDNTAGTLKFVAAAGVSNIIAFDEGVTGSVVVQRFPLAGDNDPITAATGCAQVAANSAYLCTGVARITVDTGNGDDIVDAGAVKLGPTGLTTVAITATGGDGGDELYGGLADDTLRGAADADAIYGGGGNDTLDGGDANDVLDGGAGADALDGGNGDDDLDGGDGADTLRGSAGNDVLTGGPGSNAYSGGPGRDRAEVQATGTAPPGLSVTLDGLANDGLPGETGNVGSDVEEVVATARSFTLVPGTVILTGDAGPNALTVLGGRARITGGPGPDVLTGGPQDDVIDARDGGPDTVSCGGGNDTALADPTDTVAADCESTGSTLGLTNDDRPPFVVWNLPTGATSLSPAKPIALKANAVDDRGVIQVQYLDDDRVVCAAKVAPWSCSYRPRGDDVGRNTLVAVAVDGAGQTSTALRRVTIRRFTPRGLTLHFAEGLASGRLRLPTGVTAKQGCGSGRVTVTVGVLVRRVSLRKDCTYRTRSAATKGRARFGGNATLAAKSSP